MNFNSCFFWFTILIEVKCNEDSSHIDLSIDTSGLDSFSIGLNRLFDTPQELIPPGAFEFTTEYLGKNVKALHLNNGVQIRIINEYCWEYKKSFGWKYPWFNKLGTSGLCHSTAHSWIDYWMKK